MSGQREDGDAGDEGRPTRGRTTRANGYTEYDDEEMDEGSEGGQSSGNEWQGNEGEEEEDNEFEGDDEEELSGDEAVMNGEPPSLVVQLRYNKDKVPSSPNGPTEEPLQQDPKSKEDVAKPVTATGAEDALQGQPPPAVNGQSSQPDVVAKTLPDAAPAAQDVTTTDTSAKVDVSQPTATATKTQTA